MSHFSAQTMFCDDARHEQQNKVTLVGVYNHLLIANKTASFDNKEVQHAYPKIIAFTSLSFSTDLVGETITILYSINGKKEAHSHDLKLEAESPAFLPYVNEKNFIRTQFIVATLYNIPLNADTPGEISVIVRRGKKKIISGKLRTVVKEGAVAHAQLQTPILSPKKKVKKLSSKSKKRK